MSNDEYKSCAHSKLYKEHKDDDCSDWILEWADSEGTENYKRFNSNYEACVFYIELNYGKINKNLKPNKTTHSLEEKNES